MVSTPRARCADVFWVGAAGPGAFLLLFLRGRVQGRPWALLNVGAPLSGTPSMHSQSHFPWGSRPPLCACSALRPQVPLTCYGAARRSRGPSPPLAHCSHQDCLCPHKGKPSPSGRTHHPLPAAPHGCRRPAGPAPCGNPASPAVTPLLSVPPPPQLLGSKPHCPSPRRLCSPSPPHPQPLESASGPHPPNQALLPAGGRRRGWPQRTGAPTPTPTPHTGQAWPTCHGLWWTGCRAGWAYAASALNANTRD